MTMRDNLKWLWRSIVCFITGHEDIVARYDPITGDGDLGFICARCGRPRPLSAYRLFR